VNDRSRLGAAAAALTVVAALLAVAPPGDAAGAPVVFSNGPAARADGHALVRSREASLTLPLADAAGPMVATINLFADAAVTTTLTRRPGGGTAVWTGRVPGRVDTAVLITVGDDGYVFGNVHLGTAGDYTIRGTGGGRVTIGQLDTAALAPEAGAVPVPRSTSTGVGSTPAPAPRAAAPTLDVMLLWTTTVLDAEFGGDENAARAWAAARIAEMNAVFADSEIDATARLAYAGTTDYPDTFAGESIIDDLYHFTFRAGDDCDGVTAGVQECDPEGLLDTERAQRALIGADLAFLIVEDDDEGGIAWRNCPPDTAEALPNVGPFCDANYAFGVGEFSSVDGHFTMAHEIGHLLGGAHDAANQTSDKDYARGYKQYLGLLDPGNFSTIVAYECSPGPAECAPRVGVYSNPDVIWSGDGTSPMGEPIGDPSKPHGDDGADNAAHFRVSIPIVAGFSSLETCHGKTPTILGTDDPDVITGKSGKDVIMSFGGADTIEAKGAKDWVCAGDGADTVDGGGGRDKIWGQGGGDDLSGGSKSDTIRGGSGNDEIFGGGGSNDRLFGDSGTDDLDGGKGGNDECYTGESYNRCEVTDT
jgi:Ca2+-binding RTX toxin-like protein